MDGTVGGARQWLSSSDVTFLRKSQGLVKKHSYFMLAVCILRWLFWNLHSPNTSDIMNFSFDNMGPLNVAVSLVKAVHKAALHSQTLL